MQFALLCAAVFFALLKLAATVWYVCQPDATTVTDTPLGRAIYRAGKISPALFVATLLVRAHLQGAPSVEVALLAAALVAAVVMAVVAVRQRAAGTSFGLVHDIKRKRGRRHEP
jgi:hypothetical protein